MANDTLRGTADEDLGEAAASMRGKDDKIRLELLRGRDNLGLRVANADYLSISDATGQPPANDFQFPFRCFADLRFSKIKVHTRHLRYRNVRLQHVRDEESGTELSSEWHRVLQSLGRTLGKINGHEDTLQMKAGLPRWRGDPYHFAFP